MPPLPPLVVSPGGCEFLTCEVGLPVGITRDAAYVEATAAVPEGATLLAFTDGLVERRGEVIDVGLARLRAVANNPELELDELLATLARELTSDRHHDDTAIVGIQWQT